MKQITKEEMKKLVDNKIVANGKYGYIGTDGYPIGFYRTRNRRYVEDRYADIAKTLK